LIISFQPSYDVEGQQVVRLGVNDDGAGGKGIQAQRISG
jgi:hypothetical protein